MLYYEKATLRLTWASLLLTLRLSETRIVKISLATLHRRPYKGANSQACMAPNALILLVGIYGLRSLHYL